jgi:hypothetical protein
VISEPSDRPCLSGERGEIIAEPLDATNVELLCELYHHFNTWGKWPVNWLGRDPTGQTMRFKPRWWKRLLWRLIRRDIEAEVRFQQSIAAMRVIDFTIGHKEVLRHWNVVNRKAMTDEEFEAWYRKAY